MEDWSQNILKKKGAPQKKRWMKISAFFWKQQNAFCNFSFKMKRTFSKDPEHPKIPRPRILSDLCRNFTLISVWNLSESLSEFCCLKFVWFFVWILLSEFCLNYAVWILLSEFCLNLCLNFVWILSDFLSEFCLNVCLNFVWIFEFCLNFCLNFVWMFIWILSEFCLNFCLNFDVWFLSEFLSEFCCLIFVWILLSEFCCLNFVWSLLSEFCPSLSEFLSEFCLNFVWILSEFCLIFVVWILSEFSIFPYFYRSCEFRHVWILSEVRCLNFVWDFVWILSEFCLNFCQIFCLKFVWILSEFCCLNFVWSLLSKFCLKFVVWSLVWILSEFLSEFCLIFVVWILLSEFLSEFCLNVVWIFVWNLSEFCCLTSDICLRFCLNFCLNFVVWILLSEVCCLKFVVWILSEFVWIFVWILSELKQDTRKGREAEKLRIENQFSQQNVGIEAFSQWPRINDPWAKPNSGMQFWKLEFLIKGKYPKSRIGATAAHPAFFGGDVMDLSSSFFLGMEVIPEKKGGKKRGILLFLYRWPTIPLFLRLPLKNEGSPIFSFFLWIASSGSSLTDHFLGRHAINRQLTDN